MDFGTFENDWRNRQWQFIRATASIADVTSRKDRSKGMAIVGIAFGLGFVLGPALGGFASAWDWSDGSGSALALTPFSLAALISFSLAVINWAWLAMRFRETLPPEKEEKIANSLVLQFSKLVMSPILRFGKLACRICAI